LITLGSSERVIVPSLNLEHRLDTSSGVATVTNPEKNEKKSVIETVGVPEIVVVTNNEVEK